MPDEKKTVVGVAVDVLTSEAFDALMNEASKKAGTLPSQTKSYAVEGVNFLKSHKGDLLSLGKEGFKRFITLLGMGDHDRARDMFIRTKLGPTELIALMNKNAEGIAAAAEKRKTFEAQANAFLNGLTQFAANLVVTILFA